MNKRDFYKRLRAAVTLYKMDANIGPIKCEKTKHLGDRHECVLMPYVTKHGRDALECALCKDRTPSLSHSSPFVFTKLWCIAAVGLIGVRGTFRIDDDWFEGGGDDDS